VTDTPSPAGDTAKLNSQIEDLNKKIDSLSAKLDKSEATSAQLLKQSQAMVETTGAVKAQEIMRQTVSNPSGFIAIEATNFIVKYLEKHQTTRFRANAVARGRKIIEGVVSSYIAQKVPALNWYGTSVSASGGNQYHLITKTNFPVHVNTGLPVIGNVTIARVVMEVEGDVDTVTNQMTNTKCNLTTDEAQRQVFKDLQEEMEHTLKPHKTLWLILYPAGKGIRGLYRFLRKETAFSIPLLILFLLTGFFTPTLFPAGNIWRAIGNQFIFRRWIGISPLALWFGIINGIIWGAVFWIIIRFNIIPGLGKTLKFIGAKIFPPVKKFLKVPLYRYATILALAVIIALLILWRVGVFAPPPPLQFSGISPTNTSVGTTYSANLTVTGGKKPYTFAAINYNLPAGLTLDTGTGVISGSPTTPGTYPITMLVKDSAKNSTVVTKDYTIKVGAQGDFVICSTCLPAGAKGKAYSNQIVVQGGAPPYLWGISAGQLPPGLVLSATGELTGTPTTRGDFSFTIVADDTVNTTPAFSQAFTMHLN
jgi:hypothetical protein